MPKLNIDDGEAAEKFPQDGPVKWREAPLYVPSAELVTALQLALDLNLPLLITGTPGSGKTTAAYWVAWKLGLSHKQVIHEPIRSTSTTETLKYRFDSVGYFRESQVSVHRHSATANAMPSGVDLTHESSKTVGDAKTSEKRARASSAAPLHGDFILPGALWRAYEASKSAPVVILLDEIDKASRDLPNDILFELEEGRFEVPELALDDPAKEPVQCARGGYPMLCIITSNGERDLPSPFLRRCLHHHVRLGDTQIREILERRPELGLSKDLLKLAIERFTEIRNRRLEHIPDLAEYLVWLTALQQNGILNESSLKTQPLEEVKYLSSLIKTSADVARLSRRA